MQRNDIVDIFQDYANTLEWFFSYGNDENKNLIYSDLDTSKKYLLLDPVRRKKAFSEFGGSGISNYSGRFLLVVKSNIDQSYYKNEDGVLSGKYIENIKPLINTEITKLEDLINCSDYRIDNWDLIDVSNLFDINLDGILVNFSISVL